MRAAGMSATGQKKGICRAGSVAVIFLEWMGRVPARPIDVMSLPVPDSEVPDHDLVITSLQT
jgi:hypothetical protein